MDYLRKTHGWDDERIRKELHEAAAAGAVTFRMRKSIYSYESGGKAREDRRTYIDDIGFAGVHKAFPPPQPRKTMGVAQFVAMYLTKAGPDASQAGALKFAKLLPFRGPRNAIRGEVKRQMGERARQRGRPKKIAASKNAKI
jgi:hypothetical protein